MSRLLKCGQGVPIYVAPNLISNRGDHEHLGVRVYYGCMRRGLGDLPYRSGPNPPQYLSSMVAILTIIWAKIELVPPPQSTPSRYDVAGENWGRVSLYAMLIVHEIFMWRKAKLIWMLQQFHGHKYNILNLALIMWLIYKGFGPFWMFLRKQMSNSS